MLTYVVSTVVVLLLSRFLWRRWKYDLHRVPSPPGLPVVGHFFRLMFRKGTKPIHLYLNAEYKVLGYPKLMRMDLMGRSILIVTDQSFIKNVVMSKTNPFPHYVNKNNIGQLIFATQPGTLSMVGASGISPYVKAIRKMYAAAMQSTSLKRATPEILHHIDVVIDIIEKERKNGPVELSQLFSKLTLDSIGILAFENNMGGLDGSRDIHRLFEEVRAIVGEGMKNPLLWPYWKLVPWTKESRKVRAISQALKEEYAQLVQHFEQREDPAKGEQPIWYALKTLKDPDTGNPVSCQTKIAEVALIVFAGTKTTAIQLGWIMMLLASYSQVTEKLLEEFKQHGLYGSGAREVAFDDLAELEYLTAVIKEGMRISHISNAINPRLVPKDMDILGYHIPKGTMLSVPGTCSYSSEEEWGDPTVFRPERWLTGEDMSNKYNLAFGTGPRDCIGQKLAMLEMRLVIVKLVTRYIFTMEGDWRSTFDQAKGVVIIEPKNGSRFQITSRKDDR